MARTTTVAKASGVLTATANFTANDTVIVGGNIYKFVASPAATGDVDIGSTLTISLANLALAINGTGTPGATTYFAGTSSTPAVIATSTSTTLTVTARVGGTNGNGIELREGTDGGTAFSISRTMQGGSGALHTALEGLISAMDLNCEVQGEIRHLLNASVGA